MRREVKWAGAGAVLFIVMLEIVGVLARLPWWLLLLLAGAVGVLAAQIGDAIWHRRRRGPK
jgi:CDP-diglyceride synthetase